MKRFVLSMAASRDLDEVLQYLENQLPVNLAQRTGAQLKQTLEDIAVHPLQGNRYSSLTRLLGVEVRSRIARPYRIFYVVGGRYPEVIAVLHMARDMTSILHDRFQ